MTAGTTKTRRRTGRGLVITLTLLVWLALTAAIILLVDGRTVRFYVYGDSEMNIEYGSDFTDPGVYAVTAGNLFGESEKHLPIETLGTVDTGSLGAYFLRYTTHWAFSEYSVDRRVNVIDTTPPVIELKHIEGYEPTWMTGYAEEGYTARDNVDGDLTGKVQRQKYLDKVLYSVSDSSGNVTTVERPLSHMSYQPPRITLLGEADTVMQAGLWYTDPGVTVRDGLGNDLSAYLVTEGEVVPWVTGDYQISYTVTSELGETVSAVRHVQVVPVGMPAAVTPSEKTIYLTFDDGPPSTMTRSAAPSVPVTASACTPAPTTTTPSIPANTPSLRISSAWKRSSKPRPANTPVSSAFPAAVPTRSAVSTPAS